MWYTERLPRSDMTLEYREKDRVGKKSRGEGRRKEREEIKE